MNKIKAAIIEDEIPAARLLKDTLLSLRPDWEVQLLPGNIEEAVEWFGQHPHPDILFFLPSFPFSPLSLLHLLSAITVASVPYLQMQTAQQTARNTSKSTAFSSDKFSIQERPPKNSTSIAA